MVVGIGIEPTTTWMSTKRSTTELSDYKEHSCDIVRGKHFAVKLFALCNRVFFVPCGRFLIIFTYAKKSNDPQFHRNALAAIKRV